MDQGTKFLRQQQPTDWLRLSFCVVGLASLAIPAWADEPAPPPTPPSPQQLAAWGADLDADNFFVRKQATEKLIAAGRAALPTLNTVLTGNSLEATTRAIHVLQELALSTDVDTEAAAREALERVEKERFGSVSRRAAAALATLNDLRRERALAELQALGAKTLSTQIHNGFAVIETVVGLEIGPDFAGQERDLRRLAWLDIPKLQLTLSGPKVTDAWLKVLPTVDTLTSLQIKRAAITDDGLKVLPQLTRLTELGLFYTPVSDAAVEQIRGCGGLAGVKLYGTRITRGRASELQTALANAKVDYRTGAFLGVGGQQTPLGCQVAIVHPKSAAEKAGIVPGDIIVRIGDKRVGDFDSLTSVVANMAAGDSAEIEVLRGEETMKMKVTFGDWE